MSITHMFVPAATYRIQFHKDFTFRDLLDQIPYLKALGIDTIYASPVFKARPGSTHGYDITDPHQLNPELGTAADFEQLQQTLKENQMHWLQDIVPNHMAFHQDNAWLMDIFEKGPASEYYHFFDINWEHEKPEISGKVMAPFLSTSTEDAIENGDIKIVLTASGFRIQFYENQFPASAISWPLILEFLAQNGMENSEKTQELKEILQSFKNSNNAEISSQNKTVLFEILNRQEEKNQFQNAIEKLNKSPEQLREILEKQFFRLCFWKDSDKEINYRRFFTINELICLRMEDEKVFRKYHAFIFELVEKGYFQGLRIDHIDGLADPVSYLQKLRKMVDGKCYITVEKILDLGEELQEKWPVQGTTGYFFLALVNQLFTDLHNENIFNEIYWKNVPYAQELDYELLVFEKKMYMLEYHMQGELDNLFALFKQNGLMPVAPGLTEKSLKKVLQILLAAFPVYRLYTHTLPPTGQNAYVLEKAFERAEKFALHLKREFTYFRFLFQQDQEHTPHTKEACLQFLMRCQQFTGPLAAKGVEDTLFYNYNRLISHNEVGDDPDVFGINISRFHQEMLTRQQNWPEAQNATSTHDTKRGEDARMRLNVLSEMPVPWEEFLKTQESANAPFLKNLEGQQVPSKNRLYYLYQALIGAFPMDGKPENDFLDRVKEALTKAMREAKMYSNWTEPNEKYESEVLCFVEEICSTDSVFMQEFRPFVKQVSFYGMLYSLGQILLKITAPGIPDFYQGSELWNLSMVDPDNRRPVNYELRNKYLKELQQIPENGMENALKSLMQSWQDGKIKMFVIWKTMQFRLKFQKVFSSGEYIPLKTSGNENVLAFARKYNETWCLTAVPLKLVHLTQPEKYPLGDEIWKDAKIALPVNAPANWKNIFTQKEINGKKELLLSEIFADFPIAFLSSEDL